MEENWDDDFADADEREFLASVSSAGSSADRFYQRPDHSRNMRALEEVTETSMNDVGDDFGDGDLTTRLSKFNLRGPVTGTVTNLSDRNRSSAQPKNLNAAFGSPLVDDFADGFSQDDNDGDFDDEDNGYFDTVRVSSSPPGAVLRASSANNRQPSRQQSKFLSQEDFFTPPTESSTARPADGFDMDFDLSDDGINDLSERLHAVKQRRQHDPQLLSYDDDDLGFRSQSRLSQVSTFSRATSTTATSTNGEADGFIFSDGEEGQSIFDRTSADLHARLESKKQQARHDAEKEMDLLMQGRRYDTVYSSGAKGSGSSQNRHIESARPSQALTSRDFVDNMGDEHFMDGIELGDDDDIIPASRSTLNRNVVIKPRNIGTPAWGARKPRNLSYQRSAMTLRTDTPGHREAREMQSMADLRAVSRTQELSGQEPSHHYLPSGSAGTIRSKKSTPVLKTSASAGFTSRMHQLSPKRGPSLGSRKFYSQFPQNQHSSEDYFGHRHSSGEGDGNSTFDETVRGISLRAQQQSHQQHQLRQMQSMSSVKSKSGLLVRPRHGQLFAGNELDEFDELHVDHHLEKRFSVEPKWKQTNFGFNTGIRHEPIDTYREKSRARRSKQVESTVRAPTKSSILKERGPHMQSRQLPASPESDSINRAGRMRATRGLGLIRNLGHPALADASSHGDMRFNPSKQVWEGNDIELKKFDSVTAKTPGLIAFISNKGAQVVGDMVFDPDRMCWITTKEYTDPFEDLEDLDTSNPTNRMSTQQMDEANRLGNSRSGNRAAEGAGVAAASLASSLGGDRHGDFVVGSEFKLSGKFLEKLESEDDRWMRKTKGWFSPNEKHDRSYHNEIRTMVMRR